MEDTYEREGRVSKAQRWSVGEGDAFNDQVIRLKSGKFVFRGDLERSSNLEGVPVFMGQGPDAPALFGASLSQLAFGALASLVAGMVIGVGIALSTMLVPITVETTNSVVRTYPLRKRPELGPGTSPLPRKYPMPPSYA